MNSLNVFMHFSEEIVSKLYQSIYWTDTMFKLKTRIKSIQKILTAVMKQLSIAQCYTTLLTEILAMTKKNIWLITSH
jgi:hypothetical protein